MIRDFSFLGLSPFLIPDDRLTIALCRAGALGVLELGRDPAAARAALSTVARQVPAGFGVRVTSGTAVEPASLPREVRVVVLPADVPAAPWAGRERLVQVTSIEEARAAIEAGADGLIAKGSESAGRVGECSTFVLAQALLAADSLLGGRPVFLQGAIGLHAAAAAFAGGASGVVLDDALALLRESRLDQAARKLISGLDGSETTVLGGHRVFLRPGFLAADLAADQSDPTAAEVEALIGGTDPSTNLLPMGQGIGLAARYADRYRTVAGLLSALSDNVATSLRLAQAANPLAPQSPLAEALGCRYPIVQGPMSRVSDSPAFALAVAQAGGLPFLAVGLKSGPALSDLLRETATHLAGRPFGVGLLGFAPPALWEEQSALVLAARPRAAIIAGGRPSQARLFEERGIQTWLHVPSPGLLDLYLEDGARRFIFEGRECGGHVGPRGSFALWEAQIERLMCFEAPEELHVLFAGGIHDRRSAAMVAALAAPLAARGARLGVLLGTGYLFTEEVVATGALLPGFQRAALDCRRTRVLRSAPGHESRCADTDYVAAFEAEHARLVAEERSPDEIWEALERFNLGRLALAAKGLDQRGAEGVPCDERTQRREGMYMLGELSALRTEVVTIGELHEDVSEGSARLLAERARFRTTAAATSADEAAAGAAPADVAIVGIACAFPDAPDLARYWANILDGVDCITEVPDERWSKEIYYDGDSRGDGHTYSKWGGFLPQIAIDPLAYGIPPRSLAAIDPVQLLSLEMARRALEDAGYGDGALGRWFDRERTAVIFGAQPGADLAGAHGFRALYPQLVGPLPEALAERLPELTEDSFPGVLGNVISGRIANRLDLGGTNYTVDAACASSLAALQVAIRELLAGTSDMVLCGGADVHNSINDYQLFSSVHALSPTGTPRTFDASADGTTISEGVAVLVLKRLRDAQRDGDRIYAVVRGLGAASDGKSLGLTAPRREGQSRAVQAALRQAGISPRALGLVEAHGTGTVVGDKTELEALREQFEAAGASAGGCVLGSVKSQIGHTKCAAGLAGVIKAALSVERGVRPVTPNVEQPNPAWRGERSPFVFMPQTQPWSAEERSAGVSAFGFGGTNFHAIVSSPPAPADELLCTRDEWPAELLLFRGPDQDHARRRMERLAALLEGRTTWRLRDLARTTSSGGEGPVRAAVLARDIPDLRAKLERARSFESDPRGVFVAPERPLAQSGQVAFLFPGQGSQRPGMAADLFVTFPALRRHLQAGARHVAQMFPPKTFGPEGEKAQQEALTDTRVAQPALGMVGLAMADLLLRFGVRADMAAGHSYGEIVALAAAGALAADELPELSGARGAAILETALAREDDPGCMAAVKISRARLEEIFPALAGGHADGVVLANHNAPEQCVLSGPSATLERMLSSLAEDGHRGRRIPVACAFHSPLVAGAGEKFAGHLARAKVSVPRFPVWSNTTASPHEARPAAIRALLAEQVERPVRFVELIEAMYQAGARVFVEVGPGKVLSGLVGQILGERPHTVVATDSPGQHGLVALQTALAALAVHGVAVDSEALHAGRDSRKYDLESAPSLALPQSAWLVDGHLARPLTGEVPKGALQPMGPPLGIAPATSEAPGEGREAVVMNYLAMVKELVATQREVMLSYLGTPPSEPTPARAVAPGAPEVTASEEQIAPGPAEGEAPAEEEAPALLDAARLSALLLDLISERTGYPLEMLDLDLDLEADLSIDSIKRIEILGALGRLIGIDEETGERDQVFEELAKQKTIRGIVAWLDERLRATSDEEPTATREAASAKDGAAVPGADEPAVRPPDLQRFVVGLRGAPVGRMNGTLEGRQVAVTDGSPELARALVKAFAGRGLKAVVVTNGETKGCHALVDLTALGNGGADPVKGVFKQVRHAIQSGTERIVVASALGGRLGYAAASDERLGHGGLGGLVKTVAKERPEIALRVVDLNPAARAEANAAFLVEELLAEGPEREVGRLGDERVVSDLRARPLGREMVQPLGSDAVVLITGGARGITARVAVELAKRFGCRLVLVGRSPAPQEEEPAELAALPDAVALRRHLAQQGDLGGPREIDAVVARLLREREIRATLGGIAAAGSEAELCALDVRDEEAFGALIDDIYARYGRLDGVIHGAGVLEDRLIEDKSEASFARVYDTKVRAARVLAHKLRPGLDFVVFFASVAGFFGNRGQVDYAAANDALDRLAHALSGRLARRVVAVDWGPWGGTGMVGTELAQEWARRGVGLIETDEGVDALLDEISRGAPQESQVILMRADPESLGG